MPKDLKSWARVKKFGQAELTEWRRLLEHPQLQRELGEIRAEFGLPLQLEGSRPLFEDRAYAAWMGWDDQATTGDEHLSERGTRLLQRARRLLREHRIPSQYFGSLWSFLMTGCERPSYRSGGFPAFKFEKNENGTWEPICIVTPETDLRNPLVLETIQNWQRKAKTSPPLPVQVGRKMDWRPVWEWHHRNPEVTHGQIAQMLRRNRVTVSRALERLDKESPAELG